MVMRMMMMMHLRCSPASRFGCAINRLKLNLVSNSMQQLNEEKLLASSKFAMEQLWGNDIGCLRKKILVQSLVPCNTGVIETWVLFKRKKTASRFAMEFITARGMKEHWVLGFKRKKILRVCCNATLEELLVVVAVVDPGLGFRGFRV